MALKSVKPPDTCLDAVSNPMLKTSVGVPAQSLELMGEGTKRRLLLYHEYELTNCRVVVKKRLGL